MKILIDNGHGADTPGKRSPDGRLLEYKWAREEAALIVAALKERGYDAERIVTEERDISLRERCRRVNAWCGRLGKGNVCVVSVHVNAAGADGKWHTASGFQSHVSLNASAASKRLAACVYRRARELGLQGNRSVPKELYWPQDLAICRDTLCPAILTECLFMDNREDVALLLSPEGKAAIAEAHAGGIGDWIAQD